MAIARRFSLVVGLVLGLCSTTLALTATPTVAPGTYIPSAPFTAVGPQGRPLTGASISVTNASGVAQTVYSSSSGAAFTATVPATGVVQFFGDAGTYIVTISGSGVSRSYYTALPEGGGGSSITSVNGLAGPAIVFSFDDSGNDTNIDLPGGGSIVLNIPDAGNAARGLVTTGAQTFAGAKTLAAAGLALTVNNGATFNASGGTTGDFTVKTDALANALFCDASADACGFNAPVPHLLGSTVLIFANTGDTGLWVAGQTGETAIVAYGNTGLAAISAEANGYAVLGQATVDSKAAQFARSVSGATYPMVVLSRDFTGITDTQPSLQILEDNGVAASTHSFELMGDASDTKAYITADGNFYGKSDNSNAIFGFVSDEDSGMGSVLGAPCIMDEGTCSLLVSSTQVTVAGKEVITNAAGGSGSIALAATESEDLSTVFGAQITTIRGNSLRANQTGSTSSSSTAAVFKSIRNTTLGGGAALSGPVIQGIDDSATTGDLLSLERPASTIKLRVDVSGELTFAGVSSDGTGKALCVKSDGAVGTCSTVPNGSGVCTCG